MPGNRIPVLKGHGTGNDFVLIPDLEGQVDLTAELVRRICDRRTGLGADGVLRVVRSERADDPAAQGAEIFMDHRNADGSAAQMCGNGIRLFADYLVRAGLADPAGMDIATRGGVRRVARRSDGLYDVAMGPAEPVEGVATVMVGRLSFPATGVLMPNPHAVVFVGSLDAAGTLESPPEVSADVFPDGVNVEFVHVLAPAHVEMRVHERGVGETRSCGTGACAAAWVARRLPGASDAPYRVDVPGGTLLVAEAEDGMHLIGPAEIVSEGFLDAGWMARAMGDLKGSA